MAKLPATAVTTKMAHASRPTSTTLPTGVSGFVILDETVSSCTAQKKAASPNPWMFPPFCPLSNTHMSTVPTAKTTIDSPNASTKRAREQPPVPFPGREEPRQFFPYHSRVSFRPAQLCEGFPMMLRRPVAGKAAVALAREAALRETARAAALLSGTESCRDASVRQGLFARPGPASQAYRQGRGVVVTPRPGLRARRAIAACQCD